MATTNLGRVAFLPKGAYDASTAYKRLDVVSYTDGNTYAAIVDVTGVPPTDTTKWKKIIDNDTNLAPKADKVIGAVNNNFASLDSTGNLKDSGKSVSDFATKSQGEKADSALQPVNGATQNNFASFTSTGSLIDSGKKASDFASSTQGEKADDLYGEIEDARKTYEKLGDRLNAQDTSQKEIADSLAVHKYGILWNKSSATCTRLYDAVGQTANAHKGSYNASLVNDFDSIYPWSHRKLCNVDLNLYKVLYADGKDIDNAITAWEDDPDFSYTGSNGAVMVYTPEFWMQAKEVSGGIEVVVADKPVQEFIHVPRYIGGRYFASDDGSGGITSVAGVVPYTDSVSIGNLHAAAKTKNMTLDDIWTWTWDTVLMAVEYATQNSQAALGDGASSMYRASSEHPAIAESGATRVIAPVAFANAAIVGGVIAFGTSNDRGTTARRMITSIQDYSDSNYKIINFSGGTVDVTTSLFISLHGVGNTADEAIGSKSGFIGTSGKANAYYRGRVAHANVFRYVLGAYRQQNTGNIWIAHDREEADRYDALDTSVHVNTGFKLPYGTDGTTRAEGYVKELYFHEKFPLFPFVKAVGGDSANPVGDYLWHPDISVGNTILIAGGGASAGARCGRMCGDWGGTSGYAWWDSAALPFLK